MEQSKPLLPELPTSLVVNAPEIPPHAPIMDDLYSVGPEKPVGYLPVLTIHRNGEDPDAVAALGESRGLSSFWREPEAEELKRNPSSRGDLYVYDTLAVENLLRQNADLLEKYGWPHDPQRFVEQLAAGPVSPKRQPDLYKLIAWAFNGHRPEYARPQAGGIS
jgi:hypothetical protein